MMVMSRRLHRAFGNVAAEFSSPLADHIRSIGPIEITSRKHRGLTHFLSRVIVGQQLSTVAARTIWARLEAAAQRSNTRVPHYFVARNLKRMRACGVSGNKAKALIKIMQAAESGELTARRLKQMTPEQRVAALAEIWGVGPWTVDMAMIFYFGETDIWPSGDVAVFKTFQRFVPPRARNGGAGYAARFAPNRSYLAMYMWRITAIDP